MKIISSDHSGGTCKFYGLVNDRGARDFIEDLKEIINWSRSTEYYHDSFASSCDPSLEYIDKYIKGDVSDIYCDIERRPDDIYKWGKTVARYLVYKRKGYHELSYLVEDEEAKRPDISKVSFGIEICDEPSDPRIIIDGKEMNAWDVYRELGGSLL